VLKTLYGSDKAISANGEDCSSAFKTIKKADKKMHVRAFLRFYDIIDMRILPL
jgi:hypothetical protein